MLAAARGEVISHISLDDPEHEVERQRWPRLIETDVPVRQNGRRRDRGGGVLQQSDDLMLEAERRAAASWSMVVLRRW